MVTVYPERVVQVWCVDDGSVHGTRAAARTVAENLGVDEDFVARVLAGEQELDENHVVELDYAFFLVRDVVGGDAGAGEPVVAVVDGADAGLRRVRAAAAAAAARPLRPGMQWRLSVVRLWSGTVMRPPVM